MKFKLFLLFSLLSCQTFAQDSVWADIHWQNGVNRQKFFPLKGNSFSGTAYLDGYLNFHFNRPLDNTQTSSSTIGRSNEFDLNLISLGLEASHENVYGRVFIQSGNMLNVVHEYDLSVNRGRNSQTTELEYIREAVAGMKFGKRKRMQFEMGIFNSFISTESYLTQENWSYQRCGVSDLTPFYFNGMKFIFIPNDKRRHEIWVMNGWQTYNRVGKGIGLGSTNAWDLNPHFRLVANGYIGTDSRDTAGYSTNLVRLHHDHTIQWRYRHKLGSKVPQMAMSLNNHIGFQQGSSKTGVTSGLFLGFSLANRLWFSDFKHAITSRIDAFYDPTKYLIWNPTPVMPNLFTMYASTKPWVGQLAFTYDFMPSDFVTFRGELLVRKSNAYLFPGRNGTTSPTGWSDKPDPNWRPDIRKEEVRFIVAVNFRI